MTDKRLWDNEKVKLHIRRMKRDEWRASLYEAGQSLWMMRDAYEQRLAAVSAERDALRQQLADLQRKWDAVREVDKYHAEMEADNE